MFVTGAPLPAFPGRSRPCELWTDALSKRREERAQRHFHRVANGGVGSQRHVPIGHTLSDQRFLFAVTGSLLAKAGPGESAGRWFPPPSTAHWSSPSSLYPRRERGRRSRSNPRASSTRHGSSWEREPRPM